MKGVGGFDGINVGERAWHEGLEDSHSPFEHIAGQMEMCLGRAKDNLLQLGGDRSELYE
jgi:hypothetical protein